MRWILNMKFDVDIWRSLSIFPSNNDVHTSIRVWMTPYWYPDSLQQYTLDKVNWMILPPPLLTSYYVGSTGSSTSPTDSPRLDTTPTTTAPSSFSVTRYSNIKSLVNRQLWHTRVCVCRTSSEPRGSDTHHPPF